MNLFLRGKMMVEKTNGHLTAGTKAENKPRIFEGILSAEVPVHARKESNFLSKGSAGIVLLCQESDGSPVMAGWLKEVCDINCPDSARTVISKLAQSPFSMQFYQKPDTKTREPKAGAWMSIIGNRAFLAGTVENLEPIKADLAEGCLNGLSVESIDS